MYVLLILGTSPSWPIVEHSHSEYSQGIQRLRHPTFARRGTLVNSVRRTTRERYLAFVGVEPIMRFSHTMAASGLSSHAFSLKSWHKEKRTLDKYVNTF